MQIILRQDVDNLGKSGEVVNVRDGYGRNFLIPQGFGVLATAKDVARVEHEKRVIAARTAKEKRELEGHAAKLASASVSIARAVGDEDNAERVTNSADPAVVS